MAAITIQDNNTREMLIEAYKSKINLLEEKLMIYEKIIEQKDMQIDFYKTFFDEVIHG